jgi:hypothetical protein
MEGHHAPLDAPVTAILADIDDVIPDNGRRADSFAETPVGDLTLPQHSACLGV